jgi:hypothetical protein
MIWPREKTPADYSNNQTTLWANSSKIRGRAMSNRNRVYNRAVLCQRAQALISQLAELENLRDRVLRTEEDTLFHQSADPVKSTIH